MQAAQSRLPWWLSGKEPACNAGEVGLLRGPGRCPGEGNSNPLPYSCLEKSHRQRSLVGYSPQGCKELDMTEQLNNGAGEQAGQLRL